MSMHSIGYTVLFPNESVTRANKEDSTNLLRFWRSGPCSRNSSVAKSLKVVSGMDSNLQMSTHEKSTYVNNYTYMPSVKEDSPNDDPEGRRASIPRP